MLVFRKQIDNLKTNHRVCLLPPILLPMLSPNTNTPNTTTTGSLRPNRQLIQAFLTNEYSSRRSGGSEGATCMLHPLNP
jgi:hypothetical protein